MFYSHHYTLIRNSYSWGFFLDDHSNTQIPPPPAYGAPHPQQLQTSSSQVTIVVCYNFSFKIISGLGRFFFGLSIKILKCLIYFQQNTHIGRRMVIFMKILRKLELLKKYQNQSRTQLKSNQISSRDYFKIILASLLFSNEHNRKNRSFERKNNCFKRFNRLFIKIEI